MINTFKEIALKNNGVCLSDTCKDLQTVLEFKCKKGHFFTAPAIRIKRHAWCPTCAFLTKPTHIFTINSKSFKIEDEKTINKISELLYETSYLQEELRNREGEKKIKELKKEMHKIISIPKLTKTKPSHRQILTAIENYVIEYPKVRFTQALINLNIIEQDRFTSDHLFYDEDDDVLDRIKNRK